MIPDRGKVLVVDDDDIIRRICRKILKPEGYTVETCADGLEGLKALHDHSFDLVLTDLMMPDMNGIELLKKIREHWPDTEVILITGFGTVKTAVEALKYGAYDYIEKPFTPEELLNIVARCLERRLLIVENLRLRREIHALYRMENIVGMSMAMQKVFQLIATVAPLEATVLLTGESGTGKEVVARAIHYNSPRKDGPFLVVDCGTIPDNLMEAELFGYAKGSFTGATETRKGLLDLAGNGTVFFDEIANLKMSLQAKLLRVLQEKEYRPIGGKGLRKADVRIIAATNKDLSVMVRDGIFREDLFYRLNVFPLRLPSLRERKEDIPVLAQHFLGKYSREIGKDVPHLSADAVQQLIAYEWPGNVREIENVIHRALIICDGRVLKPEHIVIPSESETDVPKTLGELKKKRKDLKMKSVEHTEKQFLLSALERNDWNISKTAQAVGMQRTNLHALMKKHVITKKQKS
ncbi:MAG TPA: sigma-54 dependent transcriptional regulator [Thermodesulfovibrionales bacterium]|nr:sigma-54 dependent transcriptional regulator [Thermodesulfovibrionales bacterium]